MLRGRRSHLSTSQRGMTQASRGAAAPHKTCKAQQPQPLSFFGGHYSLNSPTTIFLLMYDYLFIYLFIYLFMRRWSLNLGPHTHARQMLCVWDTSSGLSKFYIFKWVCQVDAQSLRSHCGTFIYMWPCVLCFNLFSYIFPLNSDKQRCCGALSVVWARSWIWSPALMHK